VEPYRSLLGRFLDRPRELKDILDEHGVRLITCSNGGQGQSCEFIDPSQRAQTVADHVAFARDFLTVFGCEHFKINLGGRLPTGTTLEQIRAVAETCNEIGRRTLDLGIKLGAHAHIWCSIERPEEIRAFLDLTDPRYVWFLPDTGQINLGGGDPVAIIEEFYDRIIAIHWKDTRPSYRGYTGPTPSRDQHLRQNLYQDIGAGGVDHVTCWRNLCVRGYNGWITIDLDPPRPAEGEGTPEDKLRINRRFLLETLAVEHL
jgi:inosose dehydratase